jgi:hypothetical protein
MVSTATKKNSNSTMKIVLVILAVLVFCGLCLAVLAIVATVIPLVVSTAYEKEIATTTAAQNPHPGTTVIVQNTTGPTQTPPATTKHYALTEVQNWYSPDYQFTIVNQSGNYKVYTAVSKDITDSIQIFTQNSDVHNVSHLFLLNIADGYSEVVGNVLRKTTDNLFPDKKEQAMELLKGKISELAAGKQTSTVFYFENIKIEIQVLPEDESYKVNFYLVY